MFTSLGYYFHKSLKYLWCLKNSNCYYMWQLRCLYCNWNRQVGLRSLLLLLLLDLLPHLDGGWVMLEVLYYYLLMSSCILSLVIFSFFTLIGFLVLAGGWGLAVKGKKERFQWVSIDVEIFEWKWKWKWKIILEKKNYDLCKPIFVVVLIELNNEA